MINTTSDGVRTEKRTIDLGTTLAAITDTLSTKAVVESVHFVNKNGSARTVDLAKRVSATDSYYLKTHSIAGSTPYTFKDHVIVLEAGETLVALSSNASSIDVHVTYLQSSPSKPA